MKYSLSKSDKRIIEAYERGYYVDNEGNLRNTHDRILSPYPQTTKNNVTYLMYKIASIGKFPVHRLVAYQKYGDLLFKHRVVVRHSDCNSLNNRPSNILIGTMSDNLYDVPKERRGRPRKVNDKQIARIIDLHKRRFSNSKIAKLVGVSVYVVKTTIIQNCTEKEGVFSTENI